MKTYKVRRVEPADGVWWNTEYTSREPPPFGENGAEFWFLVDGLDILVSEDGQTVVLAQELFRNGLGKR